MAFLPDTRGLPRAYWFLWSGALLNRLGGFVMILLAFYLRNERGLAVEAAGLVVALYGAGSLAAGPIGGALADRFGRRAAIIFSMLAGATSMMLLAFAHEVTSIAAYTVLVGLFGDMYRPAVSAAVADIVPPENRKRAYGLLYWAANLGFAFSSILAGLVAKVSFKLVFSIDALTSVGFAVVVAMLVPETRTRRARSGDDRSRGRFPYSDGLFMAFVANTFLLVVVFSQGYAPLPLDLAAHGVSAAEFGYLLSINGIMIVVLQPALTELLAKKRHDVLLATAAILIGVGYGSTAIASTLFGYAITIVIWTLGEIVMAPVGPAVVAELSPIDQRGAYQGAYQLAFGGSAFAAPLVGSLLLGRFGSRGLWGSCFVATVLAAIAYLALGPAIARRLARES